MAKTDFKSVDEYIAAQPEASHETLERVRKIIRKALPKAEEVISYQIPAYRTEGGTVIYFAGWKQHWSLYPVGGKTVAKLKDELAPYEVNNKGTVRFPLSEPVPAKLVERIVKLLAEELAAKTASKKVARKKR